MIEEFYDLSYYVKWRTRTLSAKGYWQGKLRLSSDFEVQLHRLHTRLWQLEVRKNSDAYLVENPKSKREAAWFVASWIDRGMKKEHNAI